MSQPQPTPAPLIVVEAMATWAPRRLLAHTLQLPSGSTIEAALAQLSNMPNADWMLACQSVTNGSWSVALWSRRVSLHEVLRDGDRLELCRPLLVDPMVARRERFASQGTRGAGLFSKRRKGAKAGY